MSDLDIEPKVEFVKRLDGSFKKYESVVRLHNDVKEMQSVLNGLISSGLQYETIIILLQHSTKLPKKTIQQVLTGLQDIPRRYFNNDE